MNRILLLIYLILAVTANIALSQVNTFPYSESFEQTFTEGNNVVFITNWTGNVVDDNRRIFQGTDARTGSHSLNIIPTSSFSAVMLVSLDLTGISNPKMTFYAFSKQNGSSSSTRPALVTMATSIDGGNNFVDNLSIGDETTFPNDNSTSYSLYSYKLPAEASGQSNVVIKITVARGSGSGSSAELVMDDLTIEQQVVPLALSSVSVSSSTSIMVAFNQEVTQSTAETIGNYSIDNGITVSAARRTAPNEVTLTTSTMANDNYKLIVDNVADAATNTPASNLQQSFSFIEVLAINSTTVTNKNNLDILFNLELNESSAETLTHYSIDNNIGHPMAAVLDPTNTRKVTLTLDTDLAANSYKLKIDGLTDQSTLAVANGLTSSFSYLPLAIEDITAITANELEVTFNQPVEGNTANSTSNYELDFGFGNPGSVLINSSDARKVTLRFAKALVNNTYRLTVDNVSNNAGNATATGLTGNVTFTTATHYRQIVINEIYADPNGANQPNPQVLPGASSQEFIELYNASDESIDLGGFDLSGGTIKQHVLGPGAIVILTSGSNVSDYESFGNTVAVSSWNTLTNGGEQLILKDNLGNTVDSLSYDLTWYRDEGKSDGGFSLEQINPDLTCSDANNWTASTDARGGTPGMQNATFDNTPDTTGPSPISVVTSSPTSLVVTFDEIMDQGSLINGVFGLGDGPVVDASTPVTPGLRSTTLTLATAMTSGTVYELTVDKVTDCAGNAVSSGSLSFLFDNEAPVFQRFVVKDYQTVDLIFDEALAESIAETEGNYSVDQSIGSPSRAIRNTTDHNRVSLSLAAELVENQDYVFIYDHLTDSLGNAVGTTIQTLNFKNAIDTVIVRSSQLIDVLFSQDLEKASAETVENYDVNNSTGSPKTALQDDDNAKLVHLVFEKSFDSNHNLTLSFENIKNNSGSLIQALNTTFVYDTDRPGIDSVVVADQYSLVVYFDEAVDRNTAEAINNYCADNGLGHPAAAIRQPDQRSVLLTFSAFFTNELVNTLSVSGIRDLAQNEFSNTRNVPFVYDNQPPRLAGLKVLSPTQIELTFSEVVDKTLAETAANYHINNGIGTPNLASRNARDSTKVVLEFTSLGNHASNTLSISNMKDLKGNEAFDLSFVFATNQPAIGQLIALTDSSLLLQMTKSLTETSAETLNNYQIDGGLSVMSVSQNGTNPHLIELTLSGNMTKEVPYNLTLLTATDTDGNTATNLSESLVFNSQVAGISILNERTIVLDFDQPLHAAPAGATGNYSLNQGIGNPISAVLENTESKKVSLIFNADLKEGTQYRLSLANLEDRFGEGLPASSHAFVYDVTAPHIQSVASTFTNQITVTFSEAVEKVSTETLNHFWLDNGIGNPTSITLQSQGNEALLTFGQDLTDATSYQLTVDRVADLSGNAMSSVTHNFTFDAPTEPNFRDLVINEIYPDPDANSPLPNAEFVEIYNAGTEAIKLRGFTLSDNSTTATLEIFELAANDYLILTSSTKAGLFNGNVMGLSNFPSLANGGETIYFNGRDGSVIDSLRYDLTYYHDATKQEGGYSIELINPQASCFNATNYTASSATGQGTPGSVNSVFDNSPDTTAPEVTQIEITGDQQFKVTFNESMELGSIDVSDFSFSNGLEVASIELLDQFGTELLLNLNTTIPRGHPFQITLSGINDCSGNALVNTSEDFVLGAMPEVGQILITEIMADPLPSQGLPEVDYIELLNTSNITLNLQGLTLSDRSTSAPIGSINIAPGAYQVLTTHEGAGQIAGAAGVSGFPSLNSSGDLVVISRGSDIIVSVDYTDDWFRDSRKAEGGIALEMIDANFPCLEATNWRGSDANAGGTPGRVNSVSDVNPDLIGPKLIQAVALNSQQIFLTYDEKLATDNINAASFQISHDISVDHFFVDETHRLITLTTQQSLQENILYTIQSDGLTDCSGNLIMDGYNALEVVLALEAEAGDLLINEILFNPRSGGVRFVEIYNPSYKYLNLKNWSLAGATNEQLITEDELIIAPNTYRVFTTDGHILANEYPATIFETIFEVGSLPSLANSSGLISILNPNQEVIDLFEYDAGYHSPLLNNVDGVSLERIRFTAATNDPNNWQSASSTVGFATPGYLNSQSQAAPDSGIPLNAVLVEPRTFAPDVAGMAAFTTINFEFDNPGNVLNVKIYDANGTLVKDIAQNALAGTEGFFRWDGTTQSGSKSRVGYYMIVMEIISPDGNIHMIKERVALGTRL